MGGGVGTARGDGRRALDGGMSGQKQNTGANGRAWADASHGGCRRPSGRDGTAYPPPRTAWCVRRRCGARLACRQRGLAGADMTRALALLRRRRRRRRRQPRSRAANGAAGGAPPPRSDSGPRRRRELVAAARRHRPPVRYPPPAAAVQSPPPATRASRSVGGCPPLPPLPARGDCLRHHAGSGGTGQAVRRTGCWTAHRRGRQRCRFDKKTAAMRLHACASDLVRRTQGTC